MKQASRAVRQAILGGLGLVGLLGFGGCFLPLSAGAPQMASTVGKKSYGTTFAMEAPTLDASGEDTSVGVAPAAGGVLTLAYGVAERTDLELSAEGAMYLGILPLPTGGAFGVRHQLVASEQFDLAVAGRVGAVGTSFQEGDSERKFGALYGAASVAVQGALGPFRPLLSAQILQTTISRNIGGEHTSLRGTAASVTAGAMFQVGRRIQLGPYATGFTFATDKLERITDGAIGIMIALRPDRRAP